LIAKLIIDTTYNNRKIDSFWGPVCHSSNLEVLNSKTDIALIKVEENGVLKSAFTGIQGVSQTKSSDGKSDCWYIKIGADRPSSQLKFGIIPAVTIKYNVKSVGDYKIFVDGGKDINNRDLVILTGAQNESGEFKVQVAEYGQLIGTIGNDVTPVVTPIITPIVTPIVTPPVGSGNVLKFDIAIKGVTLGANDCAKKWTPVKITVMDKNGNEKKVEGVMTITDRKRKVDNAETPIWQVVSYLGDFVSNEKLLVLVKVPTHLQIAFGMDKQVGRFTKAIGNIGGLSTDIDKTPVFDFTGVLMPPGDVMVDEGYEEGILNISDMSYIKDSLNKSDDASLGADVDGNCVINSFDQTYFLNELGQRYGDKR